MENLINVDLLKDFMWKNKLTKKKFSEECKIGINVLNKIFSGQCNFRINALIKIARRMEIEIKYLFIR